MAKRLQVIAQDPEYRDIQRAARLRRMSIAEWVRQALAGGIGEWPGRAGDRRRSAAGDSASLCRYRWSDAIQPAFDALPGVVDEVYAVDQAAVERAKGIVLGQKGLSARCGTPGCDADPRYQKDIEFRSKIRRVPWNHPIVLKPWSKVPNCPTILVVKCSGGPNNVEVVLILLPLFLAFPVVFVALVAASVQARRREAEESKALSPEAREK